MYVAAICIKNQNVYQHIISRNQFTSTEMKKLVKQPDFYEKL
jgi:hypothetical protein